MCYHADFGRSRSNRVSTKETWDPAPWEGVADPKTRPSLMCCHPESAHSTSVCDAGRGCVKTGWAAVPPLGTESRLTPKSYPRQISSKQHNLQCPDLVVCSMSLSNTKQFISVHKLGTFH